MTDRLIGGPDYHSGSSAERYAEGEAGTRRDGETDHHPDSTTDGDEDP
jgi:hypothetical protein